MRVLQFPEDGLVTGHVRVRAALNRASAQPELRQNNFTTFFRSLGR
jgi:hypothetical protein